MNFETNGRFSSVPQSGGWAVDFIIYQVEKFCCLRQGCSRRAQRPMDCKSLIRPPDSSRIDNYQQSILSCLLLTCPAGNHNTCFFQRTTTVYIHYLIPSLQFSKATIANCTIFLYLLLLLREIIVHCADFSTFKRGEKKRILQRLRINCCSMVMTEVL